MAKPKAGGAKERFTIREIDERAAANQQRWIAVIRRAHRTGDMDLLKTGLEGIEDNTVILRISTHLQAGDIPGAERVVLGLKKDAKRP